MVPMMFWGERIPRPFVSEIYTLVFLLIIIKSFNQPKYLNKNITWILLAFSLSASIQSDIYMSISSIIGVTILLSFYFLFI